MRPRPRGKASGFGILYIPIAGKILMLSPALLPDDDGVGGGGGGSTEVMVVVSVLSVASESEGVLIVAVLLKGTPAVSESTVTVIARVADSPLFRFPTSQVVIL